VKKETIGEITAAAQVMRELATRVATRDSENLVDIVGTGGDDAHTFNISTASMFVCAAAGARVAKHGNRAVSSQSGSADVLESLGVRIDLTPENAARSLDTLGITFMFAPNYHTALRHASGPRREIGVRTVFNVLGPLTNPAGAGRQLLGVFSDALVRPVAQVLQRLGSERAWVVHGRDGLDELTVFAPSHVAELANGALREFDVDPADFGLAHQDRAGVAGGDAPTNAARVRAVLDGARGAARDIVVLNTAAALVVAGVSAELAAAVGTAAAAIDSGAARTKLAEMQAFRG
jgi:anthranilate phosphoribosyltransferase